MKHLSLIEWLVVVAVIAIVAFEIVGALKNPNAYHFAPDGTTIYTVTIDGHEYLKSGAALTHSASCAACLWRAAKGERE